MISFKSQLILSLLFTVTLFAGPQEELKALDEQYVTAYNSKDAKKLASLYSETAHILQPDGEVVEGRANIENFWKKIIAEEQSQQTTEILKIEADESAGYVSGKWRTKSATKTENGKYLIICVKMEGKWQIIAEIWNSPKPETTPQTKPATKP